MKRLFAGLAALFLLSAAPLAAAFDFGAPSARTLSLSTAYQASDPTKAAVLTLMPQCVYPECTLEVRVGTSTVDCSSGTVAGTWALPWPFKTMNSLYLPIGAYFILCPVVGAYTTPVDVTDQSAS